ncbi:MAG: methyltransferase domain-containing protein [Asgard group archaeon]|nr:methyltransferase domain-containing protein [Asgard group archaeon]
MSLRDRIEFFSITFMHDTLYSLFMNAEDLLIPAGLKKGQHVLEVGCGLGFFTIPAAKMVGEKGTIYAIDTNPFAIKRIKKKMQKKNISNIIPLQEDVRKTSLQKNSLDLMFFFGVIHHLMDFLDEVLEEMGRISKKNAIIAIQKSRVNKDIIILAIEIHGAFSFIEESKRILKFQKT